MTLDGHLRNSRRVIQIADLASVVPENGMELGIWIPSAVTLAMNDTVWFFRYRDTNPDNSANILSSKWDFIGGPSIAVADETTTSFNPGGGNVWVDTTNPGPDLIIPLVGRYEIHWGAWINAAADGDYAQVGISNGAGNDPALAAQLGSSTTRWVTAMRATRLDGIANARLRMQYRDAHNSGTTQFQHRHMTLAPVRVG